MISGRRSIHCDVASALSFCGKVKLASAEVLWGWNWMVAVGDDESVNLYIPGEKGIFLRRQCFAALDACAASYKLSP